ncbi:hypothetical protein FisN_6Lh060 [Fistulifera solaris]|uniref:Pex N-terminal domain-containing protein n=1 Tax=Fistulifera solaris TaxID=1519565 RepID=A0A1Z5KP81_FISSO|nr:hypothetical protein FisN_6Lh060 [Fistulifera solaris]|eukprot:GAX28123.1 hypothetical protein FisN_6Lh060 [Fistulifera solaris]
MHDPIDLLIPKTTGALLAEEWCIDPYTAVPSFLEMKFIQDAERSGREALKIVYDSLLNRLATLPTSQNYVIARMKRYSFILIAFMKRYHAEWRCLLLYWIERRCLRMTSASCAEAVYGNKRAMLLPENGKHRMVPLDRKNATRLAILVALGPYLKEKLACVTQDQSLWGIDLLSLSPSHRRVLQIIVRLIQLGSEAGNVFCQWGFLLGKSFHFDLVSLCLGTVVRRQTQQDRPTTPSKDLSSQISQTTRNAVMTVLSVAVLVSWLTQLRVMWLEEQAMKRRLASSDLPPPPHVQKVSLPAHCPKCQGPWIDPVVPIPGDFLVYCRTCLDPEIAAAKKIVRLYEPHAHSSAVQ